MNLIFTIHAAERWTQRCKGLSFNNEITTLKRRKKMERKSLQNGNRKTRIYRSINGVFFVVRNNIVITVFR